MTTLLLAVIVIVGIVVFLAMAKSKGGSRKFPYQLSKYLLSKAERSFYGVLVQAVGSSGIVFSKVRVADVVSPGKGLNRSDWQRAFNAISSKHFDFIVCDPDDCSVRLAVELDDSSHGSPKAQKRDDLLNGACQSAGLPLLRVKAAKSYVLAELQRQVAEAIFSQPAVLEKPAPPRVAEPYSPVVRSNEGPTSQANIEPGPSEQEETIPVQAQKARSESRVCPKCGEPMVIRKAKSGAHAGKEFWGCSAFPKCRTVVPAGA